MQARPVRRALHGVLLLDKPLGWTSNDALQKSKGLLRALHLSAGRVVFDPKTEPHHHFVDEDTGRIDDVPWDRLAVKGVDRLAGVDVKQYQVVVHGRRKP